MEWKSNIWTTEYSSSNLTLADDLWKNLRPAFGTVALDHEWAAMRQLPKAQDFPADTTKGLYIIDGYHQLHCLVSSREQAIG